MKYETRVTRLLVAPVGRPIFDEAATTVSIEDEAAGEFVVVKQFTDEGEQSISIDEYNWTELRAAIDTMLGACRDNGEEATQ